MRRNLIKGAILVVVLISSTIFFVYNKPHRNVLDEKAKFSLSVDQMNKEFLADEGSAYKKYFNQIVELSGEVISINEKDKGRHDIVLESLGSIANGELVQNENNVSGLKNKKAALKGLFIGYDNLLEEIKLSECSIIQISAE
jgi:hypothetical protein